MREGVCDGEGPNDTGTTMKFLVTGGAGFIGSALVRHLVSKGYSVINLDKLTYAGHQELLNYVINQKNFSK